MNIAFISGNITRDPEIRETNTGKKVATITVAVNRLVNGEKETDFIPCVLWEKKADFAEKWLFKGQPVTVTGRIQTRKYEHNGENRVATEIVVRDIEPHIWLEQNEGKPRFAENDQFMF